MRVSRPSLAATVSFCVILLIPAAAADDPVAAVAAGGDGVTATIAPPRSPALRAEPGEGTLTLLWEGNQTSLYAVYRNGFLVAEVDGTAYTESLPPPGVLVNYVVREVFPEGGQGQPSVLTFLSTGDNACTIVGVAVYQTFPFLSGAVYWSCAPWPVNKVGQLLEPPLDAIEQA